MNKNSHKARTFFIIILVLALIVGAYYFGKGKTEKVKVETTEDIVSELPTPTVQAEIKSEKKSQKVNEKAYDLDIEYPVLSSTNIQPIVKIMNTKIAAYIANAKSEFITQANDNKQSSGDEKSTLTIRYKTYPVAHGVETVAFDISDYSAGAAHPNSFVGTLNFSTMTGEELRITDLCKDSSTCLPLLVPLYREALKPILVKAGAEYDDVAVEGSSADPDNYQVFIVTEESLDVVYNPYQVAAYAFGHVRTPVAWSKVAPFLNDTYK